MSGVLTNIAESAHIAGESIAVVIATVRAGVPKMRGCQTMKSESLGSQVVTSSAIRATVVIDATPQVL